MFSVLRISLICASGMLITAYFSRWPSFNHLNIYIFVMVQMQPYIYTPILNKVYIKVRSFEVFLKCNNKVNPSFLY